MKIPCIFFWLFLLNNIQSAYLIFGQNITISPLGITPNQVGGYPRLTYEQILGLQSPQVGDMAIDISFNCLRFYNGSKWVFFMTSEELNQPALRAWRAGGLSEDVTRGVTVDGNGNVYIIGYFEGTAIFGNTSIISTGGTDIFIAKYNSIGNLLWVQKSGGSMNDVGISIAIDNSENVYATGYFNGTATFGGTNVTSVGRYEFFVIKYDNIGNFSWVRKGGGVGNDFGKSITVDNNGSVYLTGYLGGNAIFEATPNVSVPVMGIFIAKYSNAGVLQWVESVTGTTSSQGRYITIDNENNLYLTGFFSGSAVFGSISLLSPITSSIFIAKYNTITNTWVYAISVENVDGYSITVDGNENIYMTGNLAGTAMFGTNSITSSGGLDIIVAKYNNLGVLQWVKKEGGLQDDLGRSIALDNSGNVYVTGDFTGTATFGTNIITSSGESDIFVTKYNNNGILQWIKRFGGISGDQGQCISIDDNNNIYVTGTFKDNVLFGGNSLNCIGADDIFVLRIKE